MLILLKDILQKLKIILDQNLLIELSQLNCKELYNLENKFRISELKIR